MSGESPLHRQLKGDRSLFDPGQQVGRPNLNPSTQIHRTMGPSDDGNFFLGHSRNRDLWVQSEGHSLDGVEDLLGLIQLLAHFPRPNRPNPKLFGLRCCTDPTIACAASVPSRSSRTHRRRQNLPLLQPLCHCPDKVEKGESFSYYYSFKGLYKFVDSSGVTSN